MEFFQSGWPSVARTLLIGGIAYLSLIAFLRIVGKRTLSKMNAFDFVVTIALGSTLSAAFVYRSVDVIQSILAIGYLILLQYLVATLSVRSERFQSLIKSQPVLLVSNGRVLEKALRQERLTREEIYAGIRSKVFRAWRTWARSFWKRTGTSACCPWPREKWSSNCAECKPPGFKTE